MITLFGKQKYRLLSIILARTIQKRFLKWFTDNQIMSVTDINPNKMCHVTVSTDDVAEIQIEDSAIKDSNHEKLFGVKIDNKLNFDGDVKSLWKKASSELNALARITPCMELDKKIILNSFSNA